MSNNTIIHFQQNLLFRIHQSKSPFSFGVAEKKLVIIFAYFIVLEVVGFIVFSLSQRNASQLTQEIEKYLTCELNGHDPSNPCDRTAFERLLHPTASIISYIAHSSGEYGVCDGLPIPTK